MNELSPIRTDDAVEAPRRRGRGLGWLVVLLALAGGGYWAYRTHFPDGFKRPETQQAGAGLLRRRASRRGRG
ncbi:hypothetical protein VP06_30405, partial [Methylobacterium aquaticum]